MIILFFTLSFSPAMSPTSNPNRSSVLQNIIRKDTTIKTVGDGITEYYAIIASCGRYLDPNANLPIGMMQQRYLYQSLLRAPNWHARNIIFLVNDLPDINQIKAYAGGATRENILKALDEMALKVDEDDVFLFAWQGHGSRVKDDNGDEKTIFKPFDRYDEVICPFNCYYDKTDTLLNYISDDELDQKFSQIKAKGQCLIFESCFSGGLVQKDAFLSFDENENGIIDPEETELFQDDFTYDLKQKPTKDLDKNGRIVIMASLDDCLARLAPLLGGPLSTSMALGFLGSFKGNEKDTNNNGFISVEEAFAWAQPRAFCITSGYFLMMWLYTVSGSYLTKNQSASEYPILDAIINGSKIFFTQILILQIITRVQSGVWGSTFPHMDDEYNQEGGLDIIQLKRNENIDGFSTLSFPDEMFTRTPTEKDFNYIFTYLKQNTSFDVKSDQEILDWMPSKELFMNFSWEYMPEAFNPGIFASFSYKSNINSEKDISFSSFIIGGNPPYNITWDFGDGYIGYESHAFHTYKQKGSYIVTLNVKDSKNYVATDLANPYLLPQKKILVNTEKESGLFKNHFELFSFIQNLFYGKDFTSKC